MSFVVAALSSRCFFIHPEEFMGYEKFFPYYSLSLINEQGEAKEPPGVFDSKVRLSFRIQSAQMY
jgi:hypothetical protein